MTPATSARFRPCSGAPRTTRFLGIELGLWYIGPLLVVMPAGFGVYDGGRSTAAEEQVLQSIPISAGSPDDLARSATAALQDLAAAGALSSPDIRAPLVTAHPASATRGKPATLRFCVVASDPAGNRSTPACAPFLRVR